MNSEKARLTADRDVFSEDCTVEVRNSAKAREDAAKVFGTLPGQGGVYAFSVEIVSADGGRLSLPEGKSFELALPCPVSMYSELSGLCVYSLNESEASLLSHSIVTGPDGEERIAFHVNAAEGHGEFLFTVPARPAGETAADAGLYASPETLPETVEPAETTAPAALPESMPAALPVASSEALPELPETEAVKQPPETAAPVAAAASSADAQTDGAQEQSSEPAKTNPHTGAGTAALISGICAVCAWAIRPRKA